MKVDVTPQERERIKLAHSNKNAVMRMKDQFRRVSFSRPSILLENAEKVTAWAYAGERDKGNIDDLLQEHTDLVKIRVRAAYTGKINPHTGRLFTLADIKYLEALAAMHEILEIKDRRTEPARAVWTMGDLRVLKFPARFIRDLDALAKSPEEKYLDYIQRLACYSDAVLVKICDLEENMSPERSARSPMTIITSKLKTKKDELYPAALDYLKAVRDGKVNPRKTSVIEFVMQPQSAARDISVLLEHTKYGQQHRANLVYVV